MVLFLHLFFCGLILIKSANKLAKFEERTYLKGKANNDISHYRVTSICGRPRVCHWTKNWNCTNFAQLYHKIVPADEQMGAKMVNATFDT